MTPYILRPPEGGELPLVVSIPHTGTRVPGAIAAGFASAEIRRLPMTDWHLHDLYDFLPALGATTLYALYSRFVVDLNRAPDSAPLYPGRFETGFVPATTFDGRPVNAQAPDAAEIEARRARYHEPYHARLAQLLEDRRRRFGRVYLVDAHSIASQANRLHGPLEHDIYLGNRDGVSCDPAFLHQVEALFAAQGLMVVCNDPYKGGYITDHYGRLEGVEALQIEMCQRVYMDEDAPGTGPAHPRFPEARTMLHGVFAAMAEAIGRVR